MTEEERQHWRAVRDGGTDLVGAHLASRRRQRGMVPVLAVVGLAVLFAWSAKQLSEQMRPAASSQAINSH